MARKSSPAVKLVAGGGLVLLAGYATGAGWATKLFQGVGDYFTHHVAPALASPAQAASHPVAQFNAANPGLGSVTDHNNPWVNYYHTQFGSWPDADLASGAAVPAQLASYAAQALGVIAAANGSSS